MMRAVNFDHLACSPILPEVREAMLPFLSDAIGNPLSKHLFGEKAHDALESSRKSVADLIGAAPDEIIFTCSGSESNNLAIKGFAAANAKKGKHIIASPVEHHSVLHPLKRLEKEGFEVTYLKADTNGKVSPDELSSLVRPDTILVTVIAASGEIGTTEPAGSIGEIAHKKGVAFHTDAVDAAGLVELDVKGMNIDLLSLSANVFYGPQGCGALYIKKGTRVIPLIEGGIQEKGLRAGSHNMAAIAGMGAAAKIAKEKLSERSAYVRSLRDKLISGVLKSVPDTILTGDPADRLPNHASFLIKYIEGESILIDLSFSGIAGTSGSTCSSEALKVSHVLSAICADPVFAQGSVVFTLGIDNTEEEVDTFLKALPSAVERLRKMSPLGRK